MRLINVHTMEMEEFFEDSTPPYAILSHTWETEEVTFHEMASPSRSRRRGYRKILEACRLAAEGGLRWVWVDTCCIDKSSSAELTESINSMFRYYSNAAVCFVFLSDYSVPDMDNTGCQNCKWFTRGWTLQELLAPRVIEFYDRDRIKFGTKDTLAAVLSTSAKIPISAIDGSQPLQMFSVAQRMSWAAARRTTRIEDRAYSLLGIFDIYMPLIYGEGLRAFKRLQEEIINRTPDLSILAWHADDEPTVDGVCSPLATLPDAFRYCHNTVEPPLYSMPYSTCNKGIRFTSKRLCMLPWPPGSSALHGPFIYALFVGEIGDSSNPCIVAIPLRKAGFATYFRLANPRIITGASDQIYRDFQGDDTRPHDFTISAPSVGVATSPFQLLHWKSPEQTHGGSLYIRGFGGATTLVPSSAIPCAAYDHSTGLCFAPRGIGMDVFACTFVTAVGSQDLPFGVLISLNLRVGNPGHKIMLVDKGSSQGMNLFLLLKRNQAESMPWDDALKCVGSPIDRLHLQSGREAVEVRATVNLKVVPVGPGHMRLPALEFIVTKL